MASKIIKSYYQPLLTSSFMSYHSIESFLFSLLPTIGTHLLTFFFFLCVLFSDVLLPHFSDVLHANSTSFITSNLPRQELK